MIKAIFAVTDDNIIGLDNRMPWPHSKIDMSWFVNNTRGDMVFMGSKTWESVDMKTPLPNRPNIVISNQPHSQFKGADGVIHLKDIVNYENRNLVKSKYDTKWIIGGANILKQTQDIVDEYYITRFHGELSDYSGSQSEPVRLPLDFMLINFKLKWSRKHKHLTFEIWERR
jgi:dihydrofolate reductase